VKDLSDSYIAIKDESNKVIFEVKKNKEIHYLINDKLKVVNGDESMIEAMDVFVKWIKTEERKL